MSRVECNHSRSLMRSSVHDSMIGMDIIGMNSIRINMNRTMIIMMTVRVNGRRRRSLAC